MNRRLILKGKYVLSPLQIPVSGLIAALIIHRFGISFISGLYIVYLITLLLAACSDHFTNLIPTGYNFIILLIGIAYLFLYPEDALFHISLSVSLFICLFFLPAVGSGDIKLVSASTLFLGTSCFQSFALTAVLVLSIRVLKGSINGKDMIPFAPPFFISTVLIMLLIL